MTQARAISRWDSPCSCLSRRISRIFRISSLRAGIASPSCQKGEACRGQATDERSRPPKPVIHIDRKRSTSAEIGDPLHPESPIHFDRNQRSTSSEIRTM